MIYETIPDIVVASVRSVYRATNIDVSFHAPARVFDFIDTRIVTGDVQVVLNQIAIVLCILLAGFIAFIKIQRKALKSAVAPQATTPVAQPVAVVENGLLRKRWDALLAHLDAPQEAQWKVAVMEADKLVDDALARAGFAGATFGDRLSNIQPGTLLALDGVWWAHKIRNRLAHEMDYFLRYTEARQAIAYYEAALSELQLL